MNDISSELAISALLLFGLFGSVELGLWLGRLRYDREGDAVGRAGSQFGAVQGALLGLLGLLLGFSFAGSASRFIDRQDYITREANAIGTAYLRADVLDPLNRAELQNSLREYWRNRTTLLTTPISQAPPVMDEMERLHNRMWAAAIDGVERKPSVTMAVLPAINEIIDLHAARNAAAIRHLPIPVLTLLVTSAVICLAIVGYSDSAQGGRHRLAHWAFALLIAGTLWVIIDLDYPRHGLIRLDATPLTSMKSLGGGAPSQ
ncbi:MAG: hypothetical protein KF745_12680 [Phycisphaeraceae bacterium]|nr:hypothetical protein [Phycisphaeraceae bacterium]